MSELQGYFTDKYELEGSDWVRRLPEWERKAFAHYGRSQALHGHLGGLARAATAKRDSRGRFARNS